MENSENQEIPGMDLNKYDPKKTIPEPNQMKKEMDKTKKDLEKLKGWIVKKYPFTEAIGVLPPQSIKAFIDEEELGLDTSRMSKEDLEKITKKVHLQIIVPEEKLKEMGKIREEIIKQMDATKQNIWLHMKTPEDIWELCLDSKFELASAMAMYFPLHDNGIL